MMHEIEEKYCMYIYIWQKIIKKYFKKDIL